MLTIPQPQELSHLPSLTFLDPPPAETVLLVTHPTLQTLRSVRAGTGLCCSEMTSQCLAQSSAPSRHLENEDGTFLVVKNPPPNAGDLGSIPDLGIKIPHAQMQTSTTTVENSMEIP